MTPYQMKVIQPMNKDATIDELKNMLAFRIEKVDIKREVEADIRDIEYRIKEYLLDNQPNLACEVLTIHWSKLHRALRALGGGQP